MTTGFATAAVGKAAIRPHDSLASLTSFQSYLLFTAALIGQYRVIRHPCTAAVIGQYRVLRHPCTAAVIGQTVSGELFTRRKYFL